MKKFFILLFLVFPGINSIAQLCIPLDPGFGNGGKAFGLSLSGSDINLDSRNIIVQPDNKIIQVFNLRNINNYSFGLIRYKNNGQVDSSFGINGSVTTWVSENGYNYAAAGVLQADGKIVIVDIGHYESEQFTIDLLGNLIQNNFKNMQVFLTRTTTNPINYL